MKPLFMAASYYPWSEYHPPDPEEFWVPIWIGIMGAALGALLVKFLCTHRLRSRRSRPSRRRRSLQYKPDLRAKKMSTRSTGFEVLISAEKFTEKGERVPLRCIDLNPLAEATKRVPPRQ